MIIIFTRSELKIVIIEFKFQNFRMANIDLYVHLIPQTTELIS